MTIQAFKKTEIGKWVKVTKKSRGLVVRHPNVISEEIAVQKKLAEKFLDILRVLDPEAVVAGGAPRDWYRGYKATDIDFYVRSVSGIIWSVDKFAKKLSSLIGEKVLVKDGIGDDNNGVYHKMNSLVHVFEFYSEGTDFDIMFIEPKVHPNKVIQGFDASICKILWTPDQFRMAPVFLKTLETGTITYGVNAKPDGKHPKKMRDKFPEFKHVFTNDKKREEKIKIEFIPDDLQKHADGVPF